MVKDLSKSKVETALKDSRYSRAEEVRSLVNRCLDDAHILDEDYSDIQRVYDGEPVFDEKKLKEFGIELNNSNYLDMRAVMDNITLGYIGEFAQNTKLFKSESTYYVSMAEEGGKTTLLDADLSAATNTTAHTKDRRDSNTQDYAFNKMLRRSKWWKKFQQKEAFETQLHGLSFAVWEDKSDHIPKLYPRYKIKLPANTPNDIDKWSMFVTESAYTIQEIYGWYQSAYKSKDKDNGYQRQPLAEMLYWYSVYRLTNGASLQPGSPEFTATAMNYVKMLRTGSLYASNRTKADVILYNVFIREADGSISRFLVDRNLAKTDFIYKGTKYCKSFCEIIYPFVRKPYLEHVLEQVGVGSDIYDFQQSIQELTNYGFEQGKNGSGIIINDPVDGKSSTPVDILPGIGINAGQNQITSNTIGNSLNNLLAFIQHLELKLRNNLISSGYVMSLNDVEFTNDKQLAMYATEQAKTRKNVFSLYYQNIEPFGRILLGKLLNNKSSEDYKKYMGYLKSRPLEMDEKNKLPMFLTSDDDDYGVPTTLDLTVSYSYGSGSQMADQLMADKLLAVSGSFEPESQRKILEIYTHANATPEIAEELLFSARDGENSRSRDKFYAVLAANQLEQGEVLPEAAGFDDLIFADTYVQRMTAIIKAWQEGTYGKMEVYVSPEFQSLEGIAKQTPSEQAFEALFALYSGAAFHVARLLADPTNKQIGDTFRSNLGELLNPLKEIEARAKTDAQARSDAITNRLENASEIKSETEMKRQEMLAKIARENFIAQSKVAQRTDMQQFNKSMKLLQLADQTQLTQAEQAVQREVAITDVTQKNAIQALTATQQNLKSK